MGVADRRKRERAARRDAILKAARGVLISRGVRGTTTKEIAEHCELSEATLFFYFQSKDEILLSLIFESIDFWAQGLDAIAAKQLPSARLLDAIWEFHEAVYVEHPEYFVVSVFLAQPQVLENVSPEVKDKIARSSGDNFRRLARLLEQTDDTAPGSVLADLIWSLFLGLTISQASRANLGHGRPSQGRHVRTRAFDVIKRGLGRASASPASGGDAAAAEPVAGAEDGRP
ncbi:MAG: TetR/AcrR family transcriptional regulator [Burkholderiaceae bacterium]|nr:TetR/AcrR family transcriptional regulator [Burkholderiaceae bacterium]